MNLWNRLKSKIRNIQNTYFLPRRPHEVYFGTAVVRCAAIAPYALNDARYVGFALCDVQLPSTQKDFMQTLGRNLSLTHEGKQVKLKDIYYFNYLTAAQPGDMIFVRGVLDEVTSPLESCTTQS